jgi:hypothetical protein
MAMIHHGYQWTLEQPAVSQRCPASTPRICGVELDAVVSRSRIRGYGMLSLFDEMTLFWEQLPPALRGTIEP